MITVVQGDTIERLRELPGDSIHSCVTDPPYELGFMGKKWDSTGITYRVELWREVFRVLKPGAYVLAFSAPRTVHRMTVAIEDAGFQIRDQLGWLFGSGFPKSLDVSKAIDKAAGAERKIISEGKAVKRMIPGADQNATGSWIKDNGREFIPTITAAATDAAKQWQGWGTALKPAWEPIVMARKPLIGTVEQNVREHGTGAINIDRCRIELNGDHKSKANGRLSLTGLGDNYDPEAANQPNTIGRWPANILHDGSEEVIAIFPTNTGQAAPLKTRNSDKTRNTFSKFAGNLNANFAPHDVRGSAARFFYCAKANKSDRSEGNKHPTVKPTMLMRYLCRLVTPHGGTILEPFLGSGTTAVAAVAEGFALIGFDLDEAYCELSRSRVKEALKRKSWPNIPLPNFPNSAPEAIHKPNQQTTMFKIVITELPTPIHEQPELGEKILPITQPIERYAQTVDQIDLPAVMAAVNRTPRTLRAPRKRRSDAGTPRV